MSKTVERSTELLKLVDYWLRVQGIKLYPEDSMSFVRIEAGGAISLLQPGPQYVATTKGDDDYPDWLTFTAAWQLIDLKPLREWIDCDWIQYAVLPNAVGGLIDLAVDEEGGLSNQALVNMKATTLNRLLWSMQYQFDKADIDYSMCTIYGTAVLCINDTRQFMQLVENAARMEAGYGS